MTRASLTERLRAYDRLWLRITFPVLAAMLLVVVAGPLFLPLVMRPRPTPPEGPVKWLAVIPALTTAGAATLLLALVIWLGRWTARRFGLLCPSCGAPLTGRYRRAALGAGACGRCQARVMEDAPACLASVALPTRDEFLARRGEHTTAYRREGVWYLIAVFFLLFVVGPLASWPVEAFVEPALRPAGLTGLALLLFLGVLAGPLLVLAYVMYRWEGRLIRNHGLACPWCGASLAAVTGKRAETTGRCSACGQPAWREAE